MAWAYINILQLAYDEGQRKMDINVKWNPDITLTADFAPLWIDKYNAAYDIPAKGKIHNGQNWLEDASTPGIQLHFSTVDYYELNKMTRSLWYAIINGLL